MTYCCLGIVTLLHIILNNSRHGPSPSFTYALLDYIKAYSMRILAFQRDVMIQHIDVADRVVGVL